MNNIKLLKAQAKLALSMIEPRARPGLENYIAALEARVAELETSQQSFAPDEANWWACKCNAINKSERVVCRKCGSPRR